VEELEASRLLSACVSNRGSLGFAFVVSCVWRSQS
jgi:hypothetical protein